MHLGKKPSYVIIIEPGTVRAYLAAALRSLGYYQIDPQPHLIRTTSDQLGAGLLIL